MKNIEINVPYKYSHMNKTLPETLRDYVTKYIAIRKISFKT